MARRAERAAGSRRFLRLAGMAGLTCATALAAIVSAPVPDSIASARVASQAGAQPPPPVPWSSLARVSAGTVGAHVHCTWDPPYYTDAERRAVLDKLVAAGLTWVRLDVDWRAIEDTRKGARNVRALGNLDRCVDFAARRRMKVVVVLWNTPGWANGDAGGTVPPANARDYGDIARFLAARYRKRVTAWELWNEPNNPTFYTGTIAEYAALLKAGYLGVKAGDADAWVVTGGVTFNDDAWVRELYEHGAKDYFDALATHPYQGMGDAPPEHGDDGGIWWFTHTPAVRRVMTDHGDSDAQIWFTELGWSAHANDAIPSEHSWARGVSESTQAEYAVRAVAYARRNWPYVGPIIWYKERASTIDTPSPDWFDEHLEGFALLRADGSERPVYGELRRYLTGGLRWRLPRRLRADCRERAGGKCERRVPIEPGSARERRRAPGG